MTPMEKWKQEAEIKGRFEGQVELIRTMLSNGVEPAFIARNTGVSIDDISALQKKSIEAWVDIEV